MLRLRTERFERNELPAYLSSAKADSQEIVDSVSSQDVGLDFAVLTGLDDLSQQAT